MTDYIGHIQLVVFAIEGCPKECKGSCARCARHLNRAPLIKGCPFPQFSPLHHAIYRGDIATVQHLLTYPATNVNKLAQKYHTPLYVAIDNNQTDIVCLLLKHPNIRVNKAPRGKSPLMCAIHNGNADIVRLLLATPDIDVNFTRKDGECALSIACGMAAYTFRTRETHRQTNLSMLFTMPGLNPCCKTLKPPVLQEKKESALLYVSNGQIITYEHGHDFWTAVWEEDVEEVLRLLDEPLLDINYVPIPLYSSSTGQHGCLIQAICLGNAEIVQHLVMDPRIDVNNSLAYHIGRIHGMSPTGKTPLMYAAELGLTEIVSILLHVPGIDVNMFECKTSKTALMYACEHNHSSVVKQLLAVPGIDVNHRAKLCISNPNQRKIYEHVSALDFTQNAEIISLLYAYPTLANHLRYQELTLWVLGKRTNAMIRPILELAAKENTVKWRIAKYKAFLLALQHNVAFKHQDLMKGAFHAYVFLRLALKTKNDEGVRYVLHHTLLKHLRHMRTWRNVEKDPDYLNWFTCRIQSIEKRRIITEIELFVCPTLPIDVQRIILAMAFEKPAYERKPPPPPAQPSWYLHDNRSDISDDTYDTYESDMSSL